MFKLLKTIPLIFAVFFAFSLVASPSNQVSAGTIRCKYEACNTDADCLGAKNGGVAVCREDGNGYKQCANAFCPYGKTIPGANCDCSAGRTCGQTCNASVGLCEDGKSTCRYIVGPNCRVSKPGVDDTTYCVPGGAPGVQSIKCVSRDTYNSYALVNGANPTVAQLADLCESILCTPMAPAPATLTTPINGANVTAGVNNSVDVVYNVNTGWGVACPANNNSYDLQLSYNCTGAYTSYGVATKFVNLVKGGNYCWRVAKDNGSGVKIFSTVNQFKVIDDRATVVTSGVQADVCGGGFSGVAGSALVSNPVDYSFSFTTDSSNKYREAWIAMVPDNTEYNTRCAALGGGSVIGNNVCQNMESADVQSEAIILQKAKAANGVVFKVILNSAGTPVEARAYNGVSWNSITSSGNVSGLGGTLMGFGAGGTTAQVQSATNLAANFQIRLDSAPLGKFAFYVATVINDSSNNIKTSYATSGNSFVYKRVSASTTLTNWGVDLNPPASNSAFATPKYLAANEFQINWSFNEANTFKLKSFITRDNSDSSLTDQGAGVINFGVSLPVVESFNNGSLSFANINDTNGYVNESNLGTRTYQDADPTKQSNYQFYGFAVDVACNQKAVGTSAALQKPWVIGYNGNVSAGKGITGISVPTGLDQLSETLKGSNSADVLSDRQSVYLSTYGVISGTSDLPIRKQSRLQQFVTNYEDLTIKPPLDSGFNKWYDYIYDLVRKNSADSIVNFGEGQNLNGNTSSLLGVAPGTKSHALISGNLTVAAGSTCDTQTIFLVAGNPSIQLDSVYTNSTIKFDPDFRVSGNNNGCLFVTMGDILVDNGNRANPSVLIDSTQLSSYDLIEAAIVTDGQFITKKDVFSTTEKGDGLTVKGTVVSENLYLQRDINLNANQLQPAHVFNFDPRYREIFKNDLNYNKYSIREVGFTN